MGNFVISEPELVQAKIRDVFEARNQTQLLVLAGDHLIIKCHWICQFCPLL